MAVKTPLKIHGANKSVIVFDTPEGANGYNTLTFLEQCNGVCVAEFKRLRKARSTGLYSQNHHLNGHIMQICHELGMWTESEFNQVKTEVKRIAHVMFGYEGREVSPGFWVYKSEVDCNTEECGWLIEAVHLLAASLGIRLIETEE